MAKNKREEEIDNSKIIDGTFEQVLHNSMIPYSEYVILDRALPRVEDGLKPVQRRILYTMMELGTTPDKPHRKSARIVGDCLGKYHPHGDSSVYGAMVKLAQPFNTNMLLVDGHGNFGSVDGDSAAAMRYTEARMTPFALEMLRDLEKNTVPMTLNFDDSLEEPEVLPSRLPNLLVNGANGIAVGLTTSIPPHNLGEAIDGIVAYIDNKNIKLEEMMNYIPAPDFPTGGVIVDNQGIRDAYATGKGKIVVRAKIHIEEEGGRSNIVITEIPYQVNKAELLGKINELRETSKELFGNIQDIVDETDRTGMRCVIKLKRDADPNVMIALLYKKTNLQCNFNANMTAIVKNRPMQLGLLDIIRHYVEFQREVIYKRSKYDLEVAEKREHILEGLLKAVNNIREVVDIVLDSKTYNEAKERLMIRFELTERQAIAVLDIPLKRLNKLDINKMLEEQKELLEKIDYLTGVTNSKAKQYGVVKKELLEMKKKYSQPRQSKIIHESKLGDVEVDLNAKIKREGYIILHYNGNLKFVLDKAYNLATKSIANCNAQDLAKKVIKTDSDSLLFGITNKGNAITFPISTFGDDKWKSKGIGVNKIAKADSDEVLLNVFDLKELKGKKILIVTAMGMAKYVEVSEFALDKKSQTTAMTFKEEDDYIISVNAVAPPTVDDGSREARGFILAITADGMTLNCYDDVPTQGKKASGVRLMRLDDKDKIIFAEHNDGNGEIVSILDNGLAKRVILGCIDPKMRMAKGVKLNDAKTGNCIFADIVTEPYDIAVVLPNGEVKSINTEQIAIEERTNKGKNLIKSISKDKNVLTIGVARKHNII
ncbi:MAG: DNA topoisomerase 4 subunit A [Clostridia bacterium]|nr:DNA topoisomerase 4 subunit A [Clostridia bacterium]MDE7329400.1 DNA topoisomerase 4 subunit A [Clostridia bacterium]